MKLRKQILLMIFLSGMVPGIGICNFIKIQIPVDLSDTATPSGINNISGQDDTCNSKTGNPFSSSLKFPDNYFSLSNVADTIFFDLSRSSASGMYVEFPVRFSSADSIYAMDFAFRYNEQKTAFDSLFVIASGLQYLYYYNNNDSTFRFTSNSLQPLAAGSDLLMVRFQLQYGQLCPGDLYDIEVFLNGNACSHILTDCTVSGFHETGNEEITIKAYPNPASSVLYIEAPLNSKIQLTDMQGRSKIKTWNTNQEKPFSVDLKHLPGGMYLMTVTNDQFVFSERIVIF